MSSLQLSDKKRAHHISAPIAPNYQRFSHSISDSFFDDYIPPPAYQPSANISEQGKTNLTHFNNMSPFYYPTPPPQTVIVHRQPTRSKDACCWGCLAALCLCFGAKECC